MGDNDVIVVSSDEEDEKTLWRTKASDEYFQQLLKKVKRIIFQRTRPSYISLGFPYGRFYEFTQEVEKAVLTVRSKNTQRFIWRCVVRWLVALKNCVREPTPLFDDWKYNYIVTNIMTQYINFKCRYYHDREQSVVDEQIEEIIRMLDVAFSCKTEFVLITFMKIRMEYEYRRILIPLFRAYLIDPFNHPADEFSSYVRLIICYRQWKRLIRTKENREMVNEYACGQIDRLMGSHRAIDLTLNPALPWSVPETNPKNSRFLELTRLFEKAKESPNGTRMLLASIWHDWEWVLQRYVKLYEEYNEYSIRIEAELPVVPSLDPGNNSDDDVIIIPNEDVVIVIPDDDDLPSTSGSISNTKQLKIIEELKRRAESTPPKSLEEQERTEKALRSRRYYTGKKGTIMAVNQHLSKDCDISRLSKKLKLSNLSSHSDQISRSFRNQIQTSYNDRNVGSCIVLDTTDDDSDDSDNDDNYFVRDEVTDKDNDELADELADKEVEEINANEGEGETVDPPIVVSSFIEELKRRAIAMGSPVNQNKSDSPIVLSSDDDEPIIIDSPAREIIHEDIVINEIDDSSSEDEVIERELISPRLTPPVDVEERPLRSEKLRCITGEVSSTTSLGCSSTPNTDNASNQNENVLENAREVGTLSAVHVSSPNRIGLSIADYSDISDEDLDICLNESRQAPRQCWSKFSKVVEEATSSTSELPIRAGSETPSENVVFSVHPSRRRKSTSSSPCPTRTNSPTDNSRLISPSSTIRTSRTRYYKARYLKAISASRIPVPTFNTSNRISEDSELPTCSRYIRRIPTSDTCSKEHSKGLQTCKSLSDLPSNEKPTCSRYVQKKILENYVEDNSMQNSEEDRESSNDQLESNQYLNSKPLANIAEEAHQLVEPTTAKCTETVNEALSFDESLSAENKLNAHASQNDNNTGLDKFLTDITVLINESTDTKDYSAAENHLEISNSESESCNEEQHQTDSKNIASRAKEISPDPKNSILSKGNVEFKDGRGASDKDVPLNVNQEIDIEHEKTKTDTLPYDFTSKNCDADPFILNDSVFEHSYSSRMQEPTDDVGDVHENLFDHITSPESKECEREDIITEKSASSKTENNEQSFSISECQKVQNNDKILENTSNKIIFPENDEDLSYLREVRRDSLEYSPLSSIEDDFLLADDELSNDELDNDDDIESPAYEPILPKKEKKETKDKLTEFDSKAVEADLNTVSQLTTSNNDILISVLEDESTKIKSNEGKLRDEKYVNVFESNTSMTDDLFKYSVNNNEIVLPGSVHKSTNELATRTDCVSDQMHDLTKDKSNGDNDFSSEKMHEQVQAIQSSNDLLENNPNDIPMCQDVIATETVTNDENQSESVLHNLYVAPFNLTRSKTFENMCSIKETDSVSMSDSAIDEVESSSAEVSMICEEPTSELQEKGTVPTYEMESTQSFPAVDSHVVCKSFDLTENLALNVMNTETEMVIDTVDLNNERQSLTPSDETINKDQSISMPTNESRECCSNENSTIQTVAIQDNEQVPSQFCESVNKIDSEHNNNTLDSGIELKHQQNKLSSSNEGEPLKEQFSQEKPSTAKVIAAVTSEMCNEGDAKGVTCIGAETDVVLVDEFKTIKTIHQTISGFSTNAEKLPQDLSESVEIEGEIEKLSQKNEPANNESHHIANTEMASVDDKIEQNQQVKADSCTKSSLSEAPAETENISLSNGDIGSENSSLDIEVKAVNHTSSVSQSIFDKSANIDQDDESAMENISDSNEDQSSSDRSIRTEPTLSSIHSNDLVPISGLLGTDISGSLENITQKQCNNSVSASAGDQIVSEEDPHLNQNEFTVENVSKFAQKKSGESNQLKTIENIAVIEKMHVDKIEIQKEDETNYCCVSASIANVSASCESENGVVPLSVQQKNEAIENMTVNHSESQNPVNEASKEFSNTGEMESHDDLFEKKCSTENSQMSAATCVSEANENAPTEVLTDVVRVEDEKKILIEKLDNDSQEKSEVGENVSIRELTIAEAMKQATSKESENDTGKQFVNTNVESLENIPQARSNKTYIVAEKQEPFKEHTTTGKTSSCNLSEEQTTFEGMPPAVERVTPLDDEIQVKDVDDKSRIESSEDQDKRENQVTETIEEERPSIQNNEVISDAETQDETSQHNEAIFENLNGLSKDSSLSDNSVNRSSPDLAIDSTNTLLDSEIKLKNPVIASTTQSNAPKSNVYLDGKLVPDKSAVSEYACSIKSNNAAENNTLLDNDNQIKGNEVNKTLHKDQFSNNEIATKTTINAETHITEKTVEVYATESAGSSSVNLIQDPRQKIEEQSNRSAASPLTPLLSSGTHDAIKHVNHTISTESNLNVENLLSKNEDLPQKSKVSELETNHIENNSLLGKERSQEKTKPGIISLEKMLNTELAVALQDTGVKDQKQIVSKESTEDHLNKTPESASTVSVLKETKLAMETNLNDQKILSENQFTTVTTYALKRHSIETDAMLREKVDVKEDEVETVMTNRLSKDQSLKETSTTPDAISEEKISDNQITVAVSNKTTKKSKQNLLKELIESQINQVPASPSSIVLRSDIKNQNFHTFTETNLRAAAAAIPAEVQFDSHKPEYSTSLESNALSSEEIQSNNNAIKTTKATETATNFDEPSSKNICNTESNNQLQGKSQTLSNDFIKDQISKSQSSGNIPNVLSKEELPAKAGIEQKDKQNIRMVTQKQHHCNVIRAAKQILSIEDYAMIKSCRSPKIDSSSSENFNSNTSSASSDNEIRKQSKEHKIIGKYQSNHENKARPFHPNREQQAERNARPDYSSSIHPNVFANNNQTCHNSCAKNQRGSEQSVIKKRSDVEFQEKVYHMNSSKKQNSLHQIGQNKSTNLETKPSPVMNIVQNIKANERVILSNQQHRNSSFATTICQSNDNTPMYDMKPRLDESKRISNQLLHYVPRNSIINMQAEKVLGHGNTLMSYDERSSQSRVIVNGPAYPLAFKDHEPSFKADNTSIRCVPFMNQRTEKDNVGNFTWPKAIDGINKSRQSHCFASKPSEMISYNKFPQYFPAEKRYPPLLQGVLEDATYRSHIGKIFERNAANIVEPEVKKQKIQTDSYAFVDYSKQTESLPKITNDVMPINRKSNEEMPCQQIRNESNVHLMEKNGSPKPEGNTPLFNTWSNEAEIQFLLKLRQNRSIYTGDDSNQSIQVQVAAEDLGDPLSSFDCENESNSPAYAFETPYRENSTECNSNSRIHYQSMTYPGEDIEDQEVSNITSQEGAGTIYNTYNEDCGTPVMDEKDAEEIESSPCQGKIVSLSVLKGIPELPQFPSNPPVPTIYQNQFATPEQRVKNLPQEPAQCITEASSKNFACSILGCSQGENHTDQENSSSSPNEADGKIETQAPPTTQANLDPVFIEPTPKPKPPPIEIDSEYQRTPLKQRLKRRISQCADINEEFNLGPSESVKPMDILATQALERKYNESVVESVDSATHSCIVSNYNYPINLSLQASDQEKEQNLLYQESWHKKLGKTKAIDKTSLKEHQEPVSVSNSQPISDNSEALASLELSQNCQNPILPVEDSTPFGKNEGRRRKSIRVKKLTDVPERDNPYEPPMHANVHNIQPEFPLPMNKCHSLHTYPVIGHPPQLVETMIPPQPMSVLGTTYNPEDIKAATILSDMLKTSYKVDESLKYTSPKTTPKSRKASNPKSYRQAPSQFRRLTRSTTQLMEKLPFIDTTASSQPLWPIQMTKLPEKCEEYRTVTANLPTETIWQQDNTKEILRSLSAQTLHDTDNITPRKVEGSLFGNANLSPPTVHSNCSSDSDDIGRLVIDMDDSKNVATKHKTVPRSTRNIQSVGTANQIAFESTILQKTKNIPELRHLSPSRFNVNIDSVLDSNPLYKLTSEVEVYSGRQSIDQPNASNDEYFISNYPLIRSERNSIEDDVRPFYPIIELTELSSKLKSKRAPKQTNGRSYIRGKGRRGLSSRTSDVPQNVKTSPSSKSKKTATSRTLEKSKTKLETSSTLQSSSSFELSTSENSSPETPEKISPLSVDTLFGGKELNAPQENKLSPSNETSKEYWLKILSLRRKSIEQVTNELAESKMEKVIQKTSFSIMEPKGLMNATPPSAAVTETPSETILLQDMKSTVPQAEAVAENQTPHRRKSLVTTRKKNKENLINIPPKPNRRKSNHTVKSILAIPSLALDESERTFESTKTDQNLPLETAVPKKEPGTGMETTEVKSVDSEEKISAFKDSTSLNSQAQVPESPLLQKSVENSSAPLIHTPKESDSKLSHLEVPVITNSATSDALDLRSNTSSAVDDSGTTQQYLENKSQESNDELEKSKKSENQSLKSINQLSVVADKIKNCGNVDKKIECSKNKPKELRDSEKPCLEDIDKDKIEKSRNEIESIESKIESDKEFVVIDNQVSLAKVDKPKIHRNSHKKLQNNKIDSKKAINHQDEISSETVHASSVDVDKTECYRNSSNKETESTETNNSDEKSPTTANTSPTNVDKPKDRRNSDEKLKNNESASRETKQSDKEALIEKSENFTGPTFPPEVTMSELCDKTNVESVEALSSPEASEENLNGEPAEKQDKAESGFKSPPIPVVEEERGSFKHKCVLQIRRLSIDENNLKMTLGMSTEIVEKTSKHSKKHSKKAQRRFSTGFNDAIRYDEQKKQKIDKRDAHNDEVQLKASDETVTSDTTTEEEKSLLNEKDLLHAPIVDTASCAEPKTLSTEKDLSTSTNENQEVVSVTEEIEASEPVDSSLKSKSIEATVAQIKDSTDKGVTDLVVSKEEANTAELEGILKSIEAENMSSEVSDNLQHDLEVNEVETLHSEIKPTEKEDENLASIVVPKKEIEEASEDLIMLDQNLNNNSSAKESLISADTLNTLPEVFGSKVSRKRPAPKSQKAKQRSKKNRLEEVTTTDSEEEDEDSVESVAAENFKDNSRRETKKIEEQSSSSDAKETSFDDSSSDESVASTDTVYEAPAFFKVVRSTVSQKRRPAPKSRRRRNSQHTTERNRLVVLLRRMRPAKGKSVDTFAEKIFPTMRTRSMKKVQRRSLDCDSSRSSSPISLRTRSKSTDMRRRASVDQQRGILKPLKLNLSKLEACHKTGNKTNSSEPSTSYEAKLYDERLEEQLDSSIKNILEDSEESSTMLLTSRPQIFDRVPKDIFAENGSDNIGAKYYSPILPPKSYDMILKSTSPQDGHLKTNSVDEEENIKPCRDGNEQETDNEDAENSANNSDGNSAPDLELDASEMPHIPDVGIICEEDGIPDLCAKAECLSEVLDGKIDKDVLDDKSTTFSRDYMICGNFRSNNYLDLSLLPDIDLLDVQTQFQNDNADGDGLLVPKVENLADVEIDFGSELFLYSGCIQSQDSSGSSDEKREHECETPTPVVDENISSAFSTSKEIFVAEPVTQDRPASSIAQNYQATVEVSSEIGFNSYNELLADNNPFFPSTVLKHDKQINISCGNETVVEVEKIVTVQSTTQEMVENSVKEVNVNELQVKGKDSPSGDKPSVELSGEKSQTSNAAIPAVMPDKKMVKDAVAETKEFSAKGKRERIKVLPIESLKPEHISSPVKLKCQPISFWKQKKNIEPKIPSNSDVTVENKTSTNSDKSGKTTKLGENSMIVPNLEMEKPVEAVDAVSSPTCEKTCNIDSSSPREEINGNEAEKLTDSTEVEETQPIKILQQLPELNEIVENNCEADTVHSSGLIQNKDHQSNNISLNLPQLDEIVESKLKLDTKHSSDSIENKKLQPIRISQKLPDLNEIIENKHKLDVKHELPSKRIRNEAVNKVSTDDLFDRLKRDPPVNPLMQKVKYGLKKSSSFETDDNSSRDSTLGLLTVPESPHTVISNVSSPATLICESPPPIIAPLMPKMSTPSKSENYPKINFVCNSSLNLQEKDYIETSNTLRPTKSLPVIAIEPIADDTINTDKALVSKHLKRTLLKDDIAKTESTSQKLTVKEPANALRLKKVIHIHASTGHNLKKYTVKPSKIEKESLKKSVSVASAPVASPTKSDIKSLRRGVTFASEVKEFPKMDLFLCASRSVTETKQMPIKSILVSPTKYSGSLSSDTSWSRTEEYKNSKSLSSDQSDVCPTSNQKFSSLKIRSPHRSMKSGKNGITVESKTTQNSKSYSNRYSTTENNKYNNHKSTPTTATSNHSRSSSSTETDMLIDSLTAEIETISHTLNRLPEPVTYAQHNYRKLTRKRYEQKMERLHELKKRRYEESKRYNQTSSKSKSYSERQPLDNSFNHKTSVVHNSHRDSKEKYKDNRRPYVNKFGELGTKLFQVEDTSETRIGNCREAKRLPSWDLKTISAEEIIADLNLKKSRRN